MKEWLAKRRKSDERGRWATVAVQNRLSNDGDCLDDKIYHHVNLRRQSVVCGLKLINVINKSRFPRFTFVEVGDELDMRNQGLYLWNDRCFVTLCRVWVPHLDHVFALPDRNWNAGHIVVRCCRLDELFADASKHEFFPDSGLNKVSQKRAFLSDLQCESWGTWASNIHHWRFRYLPK